MAENHTRGCNSQDQDTIFVKVFRDVSRRHSACPLRGRVEEKSGLGKGRQAMPEFRVVSVIDGDTFDVSPQWQWSGDSGSRVRPTGYDAPEVGILGGQATKDKLSRLILGQNVELRAAYRIDRARLVCDVYFRGRNLAD
jgi:endonuclease YncB( thermonuclease family)